MDTFKNLGINTVNLSIEKALSLGLSRIELSLGKEIKYKDKLLKFQRDIRKTEELNIPYSIHLPVYIEEWYPYDVFSAFFLNKDEEKRKLSFRLLEDNLIKLRNHNPDYYVLHFPGIDKKWEDANRFNNFLFDSLEKIDKLAEYFGRKIYLEYFGSNKNFYLCNHWVEAISKFNNIEILLDTGHLYFSSIKNNIDFLTNLKFLASHSGAFHLWTTKGDKAYCDSDYYRKYHHISPHIEQYTEDGWAFDTIDVVQILLQKEKPLIIEASIRYRGQEYLIQGIESLKKIVVNK